MNLNFELEEIKKQQRALEAKQLQEGTAYEEGYKAAVARLEEEKNRLYEERTALGHRQYQERVKLEQAEAECKGKIKAEKEVARNLAEKLLTTYGPSFKANAEELLETIKDVGSCENISAICKLVCSAVMSGESLVWAAGLCERAMAKIEPLLPPSAFAKAASEIIRTLLSLSTD